jgi:ABC-type transport system involved in cytochrome bd biosynthesis fused ATPase/permease subunit
VAKQILQKAATAFGKAPESITADELLAYKIAGETRKDIDEKEGMSIYELNIKNAQIKYKKELDDKKLQIAKARAANKGKGGSGKVTAMEITLLKNYYDASKGDFTDNAGNIKAGKDAVFQSFLQGIDPRILGFIQKAAPKTATDLKEMNKVLQGYMKNPTSLYGLTQ